MHTRPTIVLATANPHKVDELRAIFAEAACDVRIMSLADAAAAAGLASLAEPVESGVTFAQNARIKAVAYARALGRFCLADDSGIEIDALAITDAATGQSLPRPGVISSHYSTDGRETGLTRAQRDEANNRRVLTELQGVPDERRAARFVCCMCLCDHHGEVIAVSRGSMEGRIGIPPRVPAGEHGFGYDPLFLVSPEHTRTGAELTPEIKNRLSHRGHAARAMAKQMSVLGLASM